MTGTYWIERRRRTRTSRAGKTATTAEEEEGETMLGMECFVVCNTKDLFSLRGFVCVSVEDFMFSSRYRCN